MAPILWIGAILGGLLLTSKPTSRPAKTATPSTKPISIPTKGTILLLGDSLSAKGATPGQKLAAKLRDAGYKVIVNAIGGRSSVSFLKGSTKGEPAKGDQQLIDVFAAEHIDIVIIMLGTNDVANASLTGSEASAMKFFGQIIQQCEAAGATVIGIGPPSFPAKKTSTYKGKTGIPLEQENDVFVPKLKKLYKEGQFIDSRTLTSDILSPKQGRAGDGIHFAGKGAEAWATRLAATLGLQ